MQYVITATRLNLRTTPAIADGNIITMLLQDEIVEVTGPPNGNFFPVSCTERKPILTGFAASQYMTPYNAPSDPAPVTIMTPVNLPQSSSARRDVHANWHLPLGETAMPRVDIAASGSDKIAGMQAIVKYLAVEKSARYQPDVHTYCNIYAYDYCYLAGVFLPRVWWTQKSILKLQSGTPVTPKYQATVDELSANALFGWMTEWGEDFHWTRTYDLDELQNKVNEGRVGVICAANIHPNSSGHICCVLPETTDHSATRASGKVTCPLLSQAGRHNFAYYNNNSWWIRLAASFRGIGFWYCDYPA